MSEMASRLAGRGVRTLRVQGTTGSGRARGHAAPVSRCCSRATPGRCTWRPPSARPCWRFSGRRCPGATGRWSSPAASSASICPAVRAIGSACHLNAVRDTRPIVSPKCASRPSWPPDGPSWRRWRRRAGGGTVSCSRSRQRRADAQSTSTACSTPTRPSAPTSRPTCGSRTCDTRGWTALSCGIGSPIAATRSGGSPRSTCTGCASSCGRTGPSRRSSTSHARTPGARWFVDGSDAVVGHVAHQVAARHGIACEGPADALAERPRHGHARQGVVSHRHGDGGPFAAHAGPACRARPGCGVRALGLCRRRRRRRGLCRPRHPGAQCPSCPTASRWLAWVRAPNFRVRRWRDRLQEFVNPQPRDIAATPVTSFPGGGRSRPLALCGARERRPSPRSPAAPTFAPRR